MRVNSKIIDFYSHVNYSVTKIGAGGGADSSLFYSHVNYSVTKIIRLLLFITSQLLQSRKLFSY